MDKHPKPPTWEQIFEGLLLRIAETLEESTEAQQEIAAQLSAINVTLKQLVPPKAMSATLTLKANNGPAKNG